MLTNKITLVTGAASGIGKATAITLATKGAKVIVTDIKDSAGQATVEEIIAAGGEAVYYHLNVGDKAQIEAVIAKIVETEGRLDCAVNNAGIGGTMTPLHEVTFENWNKMININLSSVFFCMQAQIKAMIPKGGGGIVNIASLAGLNGMALGSPYCAAKHGVVGLTKSAAIEYAKANIRVNAVCPGFVETDIIDPIPDKIIDFSIRYGVPMKRLGKPAEVADAIAYLLSDAASFITGHSLRIDGGMTAG